MKELSESPRPLRNMRRPVHHLRGEETLGWGIIGASAVAGRYVIPAIRDQGAIPVPGARYAMTNSWVAGLYSHSERRGAAFAEAHQIAHSYANVADLLRRTDIQCIYIGCHPRHHATFALAALAAGKHVFCEPPLALTLQDAQAVVHTAANRECIIAVNYPHRGNAALAALRELLLDGEIGELLGGRISNTTFLPPAQQTWRLRGHGGGVLFDRTAHSIDTLRFLLHDEIAAMDCVNHQQVFGDAQTKSTEKKGAPQPPDASVEEDVLSRITLRRTGITVQCHDSFVAPHQPTSLEIYGSTGVLTARDCFEHEHPGALYLRRHDQELRFRLPTVNPFYVAIARFHSAVRHQQPPQASGTDGIAVLSAVLAAHESLRRGYRVALSERTRLVTDTSYI